MLVLGVLLVLSRLLVILLAVKVLLFVLLALAFYRDHEFFRHPMT